MAEKYSKMGKHASIQQICIQYQLYIQNLQPQGQRESIPELMSMVLQPKLGLNSILPKPILALTHDPMLPTLKVQRGHPSWLRLNLWGCWHNWQNFSCIRLAGRLLSLSSGGRGSSSCSANELQDLFSSLGLHFFFLYKKTLIENVYSLVYRLSALTKPQPSFYGTSTWLIFTSCLLSNMFSRKVQWCFWSFPTSKTKSLLILEVICPFKRSLKQQNSFTFVWN